MDMKQQNTTDNIDNIVKCIKNFDLKINDKIARCKFFIHHMSYEEINQCRIILGSCRKTSLLSFLIINNNDNELFELIEFLLETKMVNIDLYDECRYTALMYACDDLMEDVVNLLINEGADIDCVNTFGQTVLFNTFRNSLRDSTLNIVKILVQAGININHQDHCKFTAIMELSSLSFRWSYKIAEQIMEILIYANVDITLINCNGETAYDLCKKHNRNCLLRDKYLVVK